MTKTEKFPRAGYKIHFDRLRDIRAKASFIRTHKFKCEVPFGAETELKKKFDALAKVVDSSEEGSLLWFLVQMYGLGFCIARTPEKKRAILKIVDPDYEHPANQAISEVFNHKIPDEIKHAEKFYELLINELARTNAKTKLEEFKKDGKKKSVPDFFNKFFEAFGVQDELNDELKFNDLIGIFPMDAQKAIRKICEHIEKHDAKGLSDAVIGAFSSVYGDCLKTIKKNDSITFFFNPSYYNGGCYSFKENDYYEIYEGLFLNIIPTSNLLSGKDPEKELMGTANKTGGLYNFFGAIVDEFRSAKDKCISLIAAQNPEFFSKNPELLEKLAKRVYDLARMIKSPQELDFISHDWSQHRALFGSRLEGWTSNFLNRLTEFQSALASDIHPQELEKWQVTENIQEFLLQENGNSTFEFKKDLSKDFEKNKFDIIDGKTGEIMGQKALEDFWFWKEIKERKASIENCTINILKALRSETDFENIFTASFKADFEKFENLQIPLLEKLRVTVLGIDDRHKDRNLGQMIQEYCAYWQQINEFLAKWENEGIPKECEYDGKTIKPQNTDKNAPFYISKKLLKDQSDQNDEENEFDMEIFGKLKKSFIPKPLPNYPRFIGQAMKNPEEEIRKAAGMLPSILTGAETFCGIIENQKNTDWEGRNWLVTKKLKKQKDESVEWKAVWHFGQFHKSLEALKDIATRAKNPREIVDFINGFVSDNDVFCENLKQILSDKSGFDFDKEFSKIKDAKRAWQKFYDSYTSQPKNIDQKKEKRKLLNSLPEKLASFHFYLSGKEYGFSRYAAVQVEFCSLADFLTRFEKHFGLECGKDLQSFLYCGGCRINDHSATKAELLKFWWARRMRDISDQLDISKLPDDKVFKENVLKNLVINDEDTPHDQIARADATRFLQAGLGADLRAKIGILSRKNYVSRNVIQIENGKQTLLQYIPKEWDDFAEVELTGETSAKRRRQKLSARPLMDKLEKRLKRTTNNLAELPEGNQDKDLLEKRIKILEERIKKLKNGEALNFSENAQKILEEFEIGGKNNQEIVAAIWDKLPKLSDDRQKLLKVLAEIPHSWAVALKTKQEIEGLKEVKIESAFILAKDKDKGGTFGPFDSICKKIKSKEKAYLYRFPIQTSTVQKQFLERFLWGDRENILTEKIMGASVILETEKNVKWENSTPKIEDGMLNMFVAMPFEISREKSEEPIREKRILSDGVEIKSSDKKSQKQYRKEEKILGIDLGEYGFGWAIFDPKTKKFESSGFMEIPLLQKMRDQAANWKDTQSSGIFSRPTTHLADIREKAAGQIRNQIHRLALHHHAIPVYENSVDAFETGGNRIQKLYKTLKTADVIGGNASVADKAVRKHIWGLEFAQIGGVIGAAKTSQTCRACGRCATSEVRDLEGKEITVENGKIKGTEITCNLSNGSYPKRDIEKTVKNAQRFESDEEKVKRQLGKKGRGTIEKFKCQICGNETDADEQAAKNIALKYYLKLTATDSEKKEYKDPQTGNFSSLKFFLEKSPQYRKPT